MSSFGRLPPANLFSEFRPTHEFCVPLVGGLRQTYFQNSGLRNQVMCSFGRRPPANLFSQLWSKKTVMCSFGRRPPANLFSEFGLEIKINLAGSLRGEGGGGAAEVMQRGKSQVINDF